MNERDAPYVSRRRFTILGTVQGVGFRPFVYSAAKRIGLAGWVKNSGSSVVIEVEGTAEKLSSFERLVERDPPSLAAISSIALTNIDPTGQHGFEIIESDDEGDHRILVTPDAATCADCLAEIGDPEQRRHRYPFTNCTNCGPRFTIVTDIPYDRPNTTMIGFEMCDECRSEYTDPADRRFHAQPVCCPRCGPQLRLHDSDGAPIAGDPIDAAARLLHDHRIVAIKGLGGYHLATLAGSAQAVGRLRDRKHREDKPFAVMVADLDEAESLCEVSEIERDALVEPARPIVILKRRPGTRLAEAIAPHTAEVGVMLPYTPLHSLLLAEVGEPIVLTSANLSDEPIAFLDNDAHRRLSRIADAFLDHDRAIRTRTDDSVVREVAGAPQVIRRSRGYVPSEIRLPIAASRPTLAVGAELKNTIALAIADRAVLSHHIGDLRNADTYTAFVDAIQHFEKLFRTTPEVIAHDLHPDYLSTSFAREMAGVDVVGVQHHHAHIAACMVDNQHLDTVIGVAFDGLGYGSDATMWGGEFLVADLVDFERVAWMEPVPLPGGDAVMREPWRMAAAFLDQIDEADASDIGIADRQELWSDVVGVARAGLGGPVTSSVGRLFDAVASLAGVRDTVNYEGQAAIEFEQLVDPTETGAYSARLDGHSPTIVRSTDLFAAALEDLRNDTPIGRLAARFHNGLADTVIRMCAQIRETTGPSTVAISGGVFLNKILTERVTAGLEDHGFLVLRHRRVPPNDGCISLGQAAVVAAQDRARG